MHLVMLKRRADFLRIRGGARWGTPSLLIEAKPRLRQARNGGQSHRPDERAAEEGLRAGRRPDAGRRDALQVGDGPRFGLTVTKKLGSAVVRNRIRRRLRELLRRDISAKGLAGCDYVIVAREAALHRPSKALRGDLEAALSRVNRRLGSTLEHR